MSYGFKIEYTDPATGLVTDITDRVARFQVTASRQNYCREMSLDIADPAFYSGLDFTRLPVAPSIEIFTRTDDTWYSQGRFFIERPAMAHEINSAVARGVWGRSETAVLGEPFASKRSISVESDTTFFAIVADLVAAAGLSWDSDIDDYPVYAYTYARENAYPIDILSELAGFAGAFVTTDRSGTVRIMAVQYSPAAADITITDAEISALSENPEWPEFGNRIRITPAGALSGFGLAMSVPEPCMPADGSAGRMIYARLTDADNEPADNAVISWSSDASAAALAVSESNTATRLMPAETVRSDNYYRLTVSHPPAAVIGVYAAADHARANNLADGGYTVSGTTITLENPLDFCDQTVTVIYTSAGVAVNRLTAGTVAEDVTVTAEVNGTTAEGMLYIGNDCQCPPSLTLEAIPDSIGINQVAALVVYGEEAGAPITTGRMVYLEILTNKGLGTLSWGRARLGAVRIKNERAGVRNDIANVSRVDVSRFISSVDGVWQVDDDGNEVGANIYAGTFADKTIDLSVSLPTGTDVAVTYTAIGAALCRYMAGGEPGRVTFRAWMYSNREEPVEATADLQINDDEDPYGDSGGDAEQDYGGVGGDEAPDGLDMSGAHCTDDDGNLVQCAADESCCDVGGVFGCHPSEDCDSALPDPCMPANLSAHPEQNRFAEPMENGCTCEEACESEFSVYGTTQTYDNGSYRPISELVYDRIGKDASIEEYNEMYAQLRQEALQECLDQCDECADVATMVASEDNPETFDPPAMFEVSFTGGKAPFTWHLSGVDGELAAETTEGRTNSVIISDPDACGTAVIFVTDACGGRVEQSDPDLDDMFIQGGLAIEVRSVNGHWELVDEGQLMGCRISGLANCDPVYHGGAHAGNYLCRVSGGWKLHEKMRYDHVGHSIYNPPCDEFCADKKSVACIDEHKLESPCTGDNCFPDDDVICSDGDCCGKRNSDGVRAYCWWDRYKYVYRWSCP